MKVKLTLLAIEADQLIFADDQAARITLPTRYFDNTPQVGHDITLDFDPSSSATEILQAIFKPHDQDSRTQS
jgi:hypothetical protein